ncbi:hypothetical protein NL676_008057 [Syzygium grande]|nr:hypothetical protein NL676_008057 [Syzygium grande]
MEIRDCPMLREIHGLGALETLENQFRPSISRLSDPSRLQKLIENRYQMAPVKTESYGFDSMKMKKIDSAREAESTLMTDNLQSTLTTDNSVEDPLAVVMKKPYLFGTLQLQKRFVEAESTLMSDNSESTLAMDDSVEDPLAEVTKPPLVWTPQFKEWLMEAESTLTSDNSESTLTTDKSVKDPSAEVTMKTPRLVWTPQLHKRFVDAVAHLGIKNAVPKTITQLMSVDGLTRQAVASHLQYYRLYLKRMQGLYRGPDELSCHSLEYGTNASDTIPDECLVVIQDCPNLGDTPRAGIFYKDYIDQILGLVKSDSDIPMYDSMDKLMSGQSSCFLYVVKVEEKRQVASTEKGVGTDDQVNHIMSLMNIDDKDKQIVVVIQGEDGIGKTTLAKLIYNQVSCDFDGCSFLADVKETTQVLGGLQLLHTKLISDVLKRELEDVAFVNRGIEFFKDLFCNKRVLIILDDVENAFYVQKLIGDCFDCFASGSRMLVTTGNSFVLEERPQIRTYHVSWLDKDQALQLFLQHPSKPPPSFLFRSYGISTGLHAKARLPLFIDVVCAVYNYTTLKECQNLLQWPTFQWRDLQIILEGGLNYEQKQKFLDIACFTTGIDSRIALYLWHDFSLLPPSEILTPLAKTGENNQIWMHSTLRQLGREIVRWESLTDPGRRSRLYNHEIALDTVKRKKGTEKVEALCLNLQWHTSVKLKPEDFESMPSLRFLQLDHADIAGDFDNIFPKLRWLRWRGCPQHLQVTNFHLGNLTILDLSWSKVTKDWEGWGQIKMMNLRVLDLTGCTDLLVTPKFSGCKNLAMLILERCSQLVKIDHSIGDLKCLVSLNLKFCTELSMLPVEVGHLTALKELLMDGASNLKVLRMDSCLFREFPPNIGELTSLKEIHASWCRSLEGGIPSEIGKLHNLRILRLQHSTISSIPAEIHQLSNLRILDLLHCDMIKELPRLPSSITVLHIDDELKSSHLP